VGDRARFVEQPFKDGCRLRFGQGAIVWRRQMFRPDFKGHAGRMTMIKDRARVRDWPFPVKATDVRNDEPGS
jgi:hypothetical protein